MLESWKVGKLENWKIRQMQKSPEIVGAFVRIFSYVN
ncbi:hypothetical protein N475_02370 [Pseudoalteromonas luteoviolacea DSM 6061]|uniref:Uncharacterized protein n=1 Tax=Pseudoalteromonas luteoviolacea DSM 6061 TaxID=1365250 RepID=A0A166WN58_9GAMM|nr:hypothetical protein N475_02370 [Pseudoalteromonas luteoviolacea DSM 6061]